jgi:hypothetical protein
MKRFYSQILVFVGILTFTSCKNTSKTMSSDVTVSDAILTDVSYPKDVVTVPDVVFNDAVDDEVITSD